MALESVEVKAAKALKEAEQPKAPPQEADAPAEAAQDA